MAGIKQPDTALQEADTALRCRELGSPVGRDSTWRSHIPSRRGAEQPSVLAAKLGRALVPDLEACLGRVEPIAQHQPPGLLEAQPLLVLEGLNPVTPLKWRWNADGLKPACCASASTPSGSAKCSFSHRIARAIRWAGAAAAAICRSLNPWWPLSTR